MDRSGLHMGAKKLMSSEAGLHDEGVRAETTEAHGGMVGAGRRAGVTTRKNPTPKKAPGLLAFVGAMSSGAKSKKSVNGASRPRSAKKSNIVTKHKKSKASQPPPAAKNASTSGRRRKIRKGAENMTSSAATPPVASTAAPPGAAAAVAVARSSTATSTGGRGRSGKANNKTKKTGRSIPKAHRTQQAVSKRGKRDQPPAATRKKAGSHKQHKKGVQRDDGKGEGSKRNNKAAGEPGLVDTTMAAEQPSDEKVALWAEMDLAPEVLIRVEHPRLYVLAGAAWYVEITHDSAPTASADLASVGVFEALSAGAVAGEEPEGMGAGTASNTAAVGTTAAGGGSSGWGVDDDEL